MSGASGRGRSSFEESKTYIIFWGGFKKKNLKIFFSKFYKNTDHVDTFLRRSFSFVRLLVHPFGAVATSGDTL